MANLCPTELVTYRERSPDHPYLDDCLRLEPPDPKVLWVVSWGFDVPGLIQRLKGRRVVYHAHSSEYGFDLPPGVPVLAVSRNTLGYWGNKAPRNPLLLVSNALGQDWLDRGDRSIGQRRPIDVLVQARKSSPYVLKQLVPALRKTGLVVEVQTGWVDDLVRLFNCSTVYLYDSAEYWRGRGVTEGFGLPPLEALACGCVVFSSLNHALADYGDPGHTVHQIGCGRLDFDLERIQAAVESPLRWRPPAQRGFNSSLDPLKIEIKPPTTDLMHGVTRVAVVRQGVIQTAEHNASTGQRLQRGQSKALCHAAAAPVLR